MEGSADQNSLSRDYPASVVLASKLIYGLTHDDPDGFAADGFNQVLQFLEHQYNCRPRDESNLSSEGASAISTLLPLIAESDAFSVEERAETLWELVVAESRVPLSLGTRAVNGQARAHLCSLQLFITVVIRHYQNRPEMLIRAYACALALRDGIDIANTTSLASRIDAMRNDTQVLDYFICRDEIARWTNEERVPQYVAFSFDCGNWRSLRLKVCLTDINENNREIADYRGHMTGLNDVEQRASGINAVINITILPPDSHDDDDFMEQRKGLRVFYSLINGLLSERERVIVVPAGDILRVPFESLPTPYDSNYLGHKYAFIYQLSSPLVGRATTTSNESNPKPSARLVFGACDFDKKLDVGCVQTGFIPNRRYLFEPLPATFDEASAIARMLGGQMFSGSDAVKAQLRNIPSPEIIHFATHAFNIDREHYLAPEIGKPGVKYIDPELYGGIYAGIVLTGANESIREDDIEVNRGSILTPADALNMNLSSTKLITISACDSGLGPTELQDGPLGLRDSFLAAGASAVVSSFWEVPDIETAQLMKTFYSALVDGAEISQALLAARRLHRHKPVQVWAAFCVIGSDLSISDAPESRAWKS